jgi:hypothetical protein
MPLARWPSNPMASLLLVVIAQACDSSSHPASGLDGGAIKRHFSPDTTLAALEIRQLDLAFDDVGKDVFVWQLGAVEWCHFGYFLPEHWDSCLLTEWKTKIDTIY